jgi:hypothetical protein
VTDGPGDSAAMQPHASGASAEVPGELSTRVDAGPRISAFLRGPAGSFKQVKWLSAIEFVAHFAFATYTIVNSGGSS